MSIFLTADANPSSPLASNPYVNDDSAIIRTATLAMFDWSNSITWNSAGNVTGGSSFTNLAKDTSGTRLASASLTSNSGNFFPPVVNGCLVHAGGTFGTNQHIAIPQLDFDVAVTRSLVSIFAELPVNIGASAIRGLAGSGTSSGINTQWVVWLSAGTDGVPTTLKFRVRGTSGDIDANVTGAALTAILDGNLHHLGFAVEISDSTATIRIFVDGVQAASGTGTMSAYNQPSTPVNSYLAGPGVSGLVQAPAGSGGRYGRISVWNLTGRSETFAEILARDAQGAAGFVS